MPRDVQRELSIPGYELTEILGQGGMGVVYKARQIKLQRFVAIKVLLDPGHATDDVLERFASEAQSLARVKHRNIIDIYDYGKAEDGSPYFVMELLSGGHFAEKFPRGQQHPPVDVVRMVWKVAKAVAAVHAEGIVHRDLKPRNILFDQDGEPKVVDFGLVKRADLELTHTNAMCGTPHYMAPEQAYGQAKVAGPPTDVWAIGVILYEAVVGRRPFDADSQTGILFAITRDDPVPPRHLSPQVPADLEKIILKCLRKKAEDRYPTAKELARDLEKFLTKAAGPSAVSQVGRPVSAALPSHPHRSTPHSRNTPTDQNRPLPIAEGDVLNDRFEVKRFLGKGGMGAVFSAVDRVRQQTVALKVLLPTLTQNEENRQRFIQEATMASGLAHPNLVRVFDLHAAGELSFLSMELLTNGSTLRQLITERRSTGRPFTPTEVVALGTQLMAGLAAAHKAGIVHRDVKPENIWITADGSTVKLMDFGIARLMKDSQLISTGRAMGTAYYMSPEQMRADPHVDHRTDQFAVGVVLYELLTDELPQGAVQKPHELRRDIPVRLSEAVMTALASKPYNRHADMTAFAESIRLRRAVRLPRNILTGLAVGVIVGGIGLGGYWIVSSLPSTNTNPRLGDGQAKHTAANKQGDSQALFPAPGPAAEPELPLTELLTKAVEATLKAKAVPADVQSLVARGASADHQQFGKRFDTDQRLADLIKQCQASLEVGKTLLTNQPADARGKLTEARTQADTVNTWFSTAQQQLTALASRRADVKARTENPNGLPDALMKWATGKLDAVPPALFDAQDPDAAKKLLDTVAKTLADADDLIPKSRAFRDELLRESQKLPAEGVYDASRTRSAAIAAELVAVETDFHTGDSAAAAKRYAKAQTDVEQLRGDLPALHAELRWQEADGIGRSLRSGSSVNRRRLADQYAKETWVKDALAAARTALDAGRDLLKTDPPAARSKFDAGIAAAERIVQWDREVKPYLASLDTARDEITQDRANDRLPAKLLTWADAELDAAVTGLAKPSPADPAAVIRSVSKALQSARAVLGRVAQLETDLRTTGNNIPQGKHFNDARAVLASARGSLAGVRKSIDDNDLSAAERTLAELETVTVQVAEKVTDGHIRTSQEAIRDHRPGDALRAADQALRGRPSAAAFAVRSVALHQLHDYKGALKAADKAIDLDSTSAAAFAARSRAYDEIGDFKKAVAAGRRATELAPNSADAWAAYAEATADDKDLDTAAELANKAVALDPTLGIAHRTVGYIHMKRDDYKTAIQHFTRAIQVEPKFPTPYNDRGFCKQRLGDLDGAIADYTRSIEQAPHFVSGYINRSEAHVKNKDFDKAITDYDRLIELEYQTPLMYNGRGNLYKEQKKYSLAIRDFRKVVELSPNDTLGYINLGWVLMEVDQAEEAVAVLTKALEIDPNCTSAYWNRGSAYQKLGQKTRADADIKRAEKLTADGKK